MTNTIIKYLKGCTAVLAFSLLAANAEAQTVNPNTGTIPNINPSTGTTPSLNPNWGLAGGGSSMPTVDLTVNEDYLATLAGTAAAEKLTSSSTLTSIKNLLVEDDVFYKRIEDEAVTPYITKFQGTLTDLTTVINNDYLSKADADALVNTHITSKLDDFVGKIEATKLARCAIPPSCADLGFTQTETQCAGKQKLKCPLNQSKVYCGGEDTSNSCVSGLSLLTSSGLKYCCLNGSTASDVNSKCILARLDQPIQKLFLDNVNLKAELATVNTDLKEFKKLDIEALKTVSTYKDKFIQLKDISSSNINALKSEVDVATLSNKFVNTVGKVSEMYSCSYTGPQICTSTPWAP